LVMVFGVSTLTTGGRLYGNLYDGRSWHPNVNQDVSDGLCMMYSHSVNKTSLGAPLAVMVSVCRPN
jgi:hypothetical protein